MLKKTIPLLVAGLALLVLVGCGANGAKATPLELVPRKADMVGHITLSQILKDGDLIGLYDKLPKDSGEPQTFDDVIAAVIDETGIDLRNINEVFIFGETSSVTGDGDYTGAIAKGGFEKDVFIAAIAEAREAELTPSDYKGYEVYTDLDMSGAIAFLSEDTFVVGSVELVEDVIDVAVGDEPALSGDVLDGYSNLGNVLVKIAASVPSDITEDAVDEASDSISIPLDLSALADLETAELTLAREEGAIALDLKLCFTNEESAKAAKGLISLAKATIGRFDIPEEGPRGRPIPEEGQELLPEVLDKLETEVIDSCLTINLKMTLDEIEELMAERGPGSPAPQRPQRAPSPSLDTKSFMPLKQEST